MFGEKEEKTRIEVDSDELPYSVMFNVEDAGDNYSLSVCSSQHFNDRFSKWLPIRVPKDEDLKSYVVKEFKERILPEYYQEQETSDSRKKLHQRLVEEANGRVLDMGCGSGELAELLEKRGHQVLCLDINKKLLRQASDSGKTSILASSERLPFKDHAMEGATNLASVSLYYTDWESVFGEVERVGGDFLIAPNNLDLWFNYKKKLKDKGYQVKGSYRTPYWLKATKREKEDRGSVLSRLSQRLNFL